MMKKFLFVTLCVLQSVFSFAEKTPINSLHSYVLNNGLSLFVVENHSIPLTYIEVCVRCGGYTQNPENVGVFHLYEHMMFKGNSLYKNASELDRVTREMGVSDRNGTTDVERVNYFFTVPSELTEKGLEFWNAAIRFPNLDKKELENEKKVVIAEINGRLSDPRYKVYKTQQNYLFPENQHTIDALGNEDYIQKATVKQLKDIQKRYYIPNNSALIVAGDVNPDEVYEMAKRIFGSWKRGKNPSENGIVRHSKESFSEPMLLFQPMDTVSKEIAGVSIQFRGPDAAYDLEDTYTADFLLKVMNQPEGDFITSLVNDGAIGIPSSDYCGSGYHTRKTCGVLVFGANLILPEEDLAERVLYLASKLPEYTKKAVTNLSEDDVKRFETILENDAIVERQTAFSLAASLSFWWSVTDENYYYNYNKKLRTISVPEMTAFVEKYYEGKNPLITITLNPEVLEKCRKSLEDSGFKICF